MAKRSDLNKSLRHHEGEIKDIDKLPEDQRVRPLPKSDTTHPPADALCVLLVEETPIGHTVAIGPLTPTERMFCLAAA